MSITRRALLGTAAAGLAAPHVALADTVIRVASLKLIHSIAPNFYQQFAPAGVRVEVSPFENPADAKNAVVTHSADFGLHGVAVAILGGASREPVTIVSSCCDKGMAIVARADGPVHALADLRGKRVAIWPGSTQEAFVLERLRMEGMSVRDLTPVRISFSEMHAALVRGDVDAYVGAEPGPGISVASGVGRIVEYPYSTNMGSLNMVVSAHQETARDNPELCRTLIRMHRAASEYAMANPPAMVEMAVRVLGQRRDALEISVPNVELNWRMTPAMIERTHIYADHMLALRQIRALPDFGTLLTTRYSDELASAA